VPQVPQLSGSVIVLAQVPPEQAVVPVAQPDEEQALLLHTCVLLQVEPQLPQFALLCETQLPLQFKRPVPQVHTPD